MKVPTCLRTIAVAIFMLSVAPLAQSMTEKDAANNIVLFATAMKEAELCEKLGYPSQELVRSWEKRHADVLLQSMQRIEQHALNSKTVNAEGARDVALGFFIRAKARFDREIAPTRGPRTCARFNESLHEYQVRFVAK
jgi:flagellar biosynthesis regulator FlbT